jgi:hypothetical protein
MRHKYSKNKIVKLMLALFMLVMILAINASVVTCHSVQDIPTSICEYIDHDDFEEVRIENITHSNVVLLGFLVSFSYSKIIVLQLPIAIFQPPKIA